MTFEEYKTYKEKAIENKAAKEFEEAGDRFTLAMHAILAESEYVTKPFEDDSLNSARGLRCLLSAALYYRVGENLDRCRNRCKQGILLTEDLRDHVVTHDPQRGLMYEYIGDFRVIGNLEGWRVAYDTASDYYAECRNPIQWQAEPEFELNISFLLDLAEEGGIAVSRKQKNEISAESLTKRIAYKRENFPTIVDQFLPSGH